MLFGQWIINNSDSSYFQSDTLSIDNDLKFEAIPQEGCKFILWKIEAKNSQIFTYENCEEKWNKKIISDKLLIELEEMDNSYFFLIQDNKNEIKAKFKVTYYTEDKGTIRGNKWKAFGLARVK